MGRGGTVSVGGVFEPWGKGGRVEGRAGSSSGGRGEDDRGCYA
jgi:hypothetical protein